jgi:uncharacterized membrane protein YjdF
VALGKGCSREEAYPILLAVIYFTVLAWSAIKPGDYFTWVLEVAPAVLLFSRYHDRKMAVLKGQGISPA